MAEEGRSAFCPDFHSAVELVGRRWTGCIVRALLSGETRFSAIAETVPGMSDRMLSERLRELEEEGVLIRTVFPDTPVRIDYTLTEKGRELAPVVDALSAWADKWAASSQGCGDAQAGLHEEEIRG
jgi:DNA-binding HxlR family transcriptional regulator